MSFKPKTLRDYNLIKKGSYSYFFNIPTNAHNIRIHFEKH